MSYSLVTKCNVCRKKDQCVDSTFVQAAISGIHSVNWANGKEKHLHLGAGSIEIKCYNLDDERNEAVEPIDQAISESTCQGVPEPVNR